MPVKLKRFVFYWLPLIVYCVLIFIQSGHPSPEELPSFRFMDKLLHVAAYGVMGVLFYRAYQTLRVKSSRQMLIWLSLASASAYGISDEIHQYFVPERNADVLDVAADIVGALCGVYLYQLWVRRRQRDRGQRVEDRKPNSKSQAPNYK